MILHGGSAEIKNGMAALPQMRRQDAGADVAAHGAGGFPPVLPEMQIHLCDPVSERKNRRN